MFVTFFIVNIYLLMSGLFTPIDSMADWVQVVSLVNPVRHFVTIARALLVRGASLPDIQTPFAHPGGVRCRAPGPRDPPVLQANGLTRAARGCAAWLFAPARQHRSAEVDRIRPATATGRLGWSSIRTDTSQRQTACMCIRLRYLRIAAPTAAAATWPMRTTSGRR